MKVKIQFTIDIENVVEEVRKRLVLNNKIADNVKTQFNEIIQKIDDNNIVSCCEQIDNLRRQLTDIDNVLNDSYNILSGYAAYKTKLLEEQIKPEQEFSNENEK